MKERRYRLSIAGFSFCCFLSLFIRFLVRFEVMVFWDPVDLQVDYPLLPSCPAVTCFEYLVSVISINKLVLFSI